MHIYTHLHLLLQMYSYLPLEVPSKLNVFFFRYEVFCKASLSCLAITLIAKTPVKLYGCLSVLTSWNGSVASGRVNKLTSPCSDVYQL